MAREKNPFLEEFLPKVYLTKQEAEDYETKTTAGDACFVRSDILETASEALEKIRGSQHAAHCLGYGATKIAFKCTCHVAVARDALMEIEHV